MVCTANDLSAWRDFPKGLRVLLLEKDSTSAADIKSKLEAMDYVVSIFCNENEALSAVADNPECYHVAIVEVNTSNSAGSFKFLETAKELPTIMTSDVDCLSITMKCIALGAVEFLRKPISEDKLKNIWQHVVHKAFNAGGSVLSESLKPVKDFVASTLQLELETEVAMNETIEDVNLASLAHESGHEQTPGSDKYPAPSTPQLKQGLRLLDDGDCQDHTYSSAEKECGEQEGESKSVETTTFPATEVMQQVDHHQSVSETAVKEEDDSVDCPKSLSNISSHVQSKDDLNLSHPDNSAENPIKVSSSLDSCETRASRKKSKIDWTPELHKKFVQAVERLGVDQAIPSRILEVMKVEGLTRHNVASHLQKYRMHRRHILPKEDDRKWLQQRDRMQRSYYPHKPIVAYPPYHSNQTYPYSPLYPLWGATGSHLGGVQLWRPPGYPPWPPTESWHWKPPYLGMQADAWGCPVMPPPPPPNPYSSPPPNVMGFHDTVTVDSVCNAPQNSFDLHPAQEVIDMVVKEAMSKPWLPLPLGLKPPATESVLAELSRQGIPRVPPQDQRH